MNVLKSIWTIAVRECGILRSNPVYLFCMVIFPVLVVLFFTSLMNEGQPVEMPVGIVDLDNTPTTRSLVRKLDGFQTTHVVGRYPNLNEARNAIQRNQIYAFLYIPKGTTDGLLAARQPKISFYYTNTSLTAGALLYRDLKTIATLGSAAVGQGTLRAKGLTDEQIQTFLQPISVDLHPINNPWINYNVYLSTVLIPGVLMLFMLLLTAYSLGGKHSYCGAGKALAANTGFPARAVCLPLLYVRLSAIPPCGWHRAHGAAFGACGGGIARFRLVHVRTASFAAHVNECVLAVGGAQLFNGGLGLPGDGNGHTA